MKGIAFIFLILGFSVLSRFAQPIVLEHRHSDVRHPQLSSVSNTLLAQGLEEQGAEVPKTEPNLSTQGDNPVERVERQEQTSETVPNNPTQQTEAAASENGETSAGNAHGVEKNATDLQDP